MPIKTETAIKGLMSSTETPAMSLNTKSLKVKVKLLRVAAEKFKFRNSVPLHNTVLVVYSDRERGEEGFYLLLLTARHKIKLD